MKKGSTKKSFRKTSQRNEKPTFVGDMKKLFGGIKKLVSETDLTIKRGNVEFKKDNQNNVDLTLDRGTHKTNVKVSNRFAVSINNVEVPNNIETSNDTKIV